MTSCKCGAEWTGKRLEHCTATGCHQTFTGTTAGDMHRVGKHDVSEGPDRRRCLTPDEMREKGMTQNKHGHWTSGGTFWRAGDDLGLRTGAPEGEDTGEQVSGPQIGSQRIRDLIEASSFGTPEAKAARETVTDEQVRRVLARAEELRREGSA